MSDTEQLMSPTRSTRRTTRKSTTTDDLLSSATNTTTAGKSKRKRMKNHPVLDNEDNESVNSIQSQVTENLNQDNVNDAIPSEPSANKKSRVSDSIPLHTISEDSTNISMNGSALRQSRLNEKQTLSELNKRLEMYILKVRERDASSGSIDRELNLAKTQYTTELNHIRDAYESQIELLRKHKSDTTSEKLKIEYIAKEHSDTIKRLTTELHDNQSRVELAELHVNQLTIQLNDITNQLHDSKSDNDKLNKKLTDVSKQLVQYQQQAESVQQQYDTVQLELKQITSKYNNLLDDMNSLQLTKDTEIKQLNSQLHELTSQASTMEDVLRREFGKQLKQILEERQLQYEAEKNDIIDELRELYSTQLDERDKQIEQQAEQFTHQSDMIRQLEQRMINERNDAQSAVAQKQALEIRVQQLTNDIQNINSQLDIEITNKNDQQRVYLQTVKRKDDEFQTLMDVKVALDNEIRQYRMLLENEEYRIQDNEQFNNNAPNSQSNNISITINQKNKLVSVTNNESFVISMSGYTLSCDESGAEYKFAANISLQSNDTINVSTRGSDNDTLYWSVDDDDVFGKHCTVVLRDAQDNIVDQATAAK